MADSRADELLRQHDGMASDRAVFEGLWRQIEERFSFKGAYIQNKSKTQGEKSTQRIFDETCILAADRFSAACDSLVSPRTQRYHTIAPEDPALEDDKEVKDWCEMATDALFTARYMPQANFASQIYESYWQTGVFGTGCVFVDDNVGKHLVYRAIHLAELYIAENSAGTVDKVHRSFSPTLRQIAQRFGEDAMGEKLRAAFAKNPEDRIEVLHCVKPNDGRDVRRMDYRGMAMSSYYIACNERHVLEESGYRTMPYCVARYSTSPREVYGRGPGVLSLAAVNNLNEMMKTMLRAGQKAVDPPILLPDDALLRQFDLRAGGLNYGGLSDQGQELARPFQSGARIDFGEWFIERATKIVNDAFLVTLFDVLLQTPQMTATEAMLRAQQRGQLLAPIAGRLQEQQGVMVEREVDILAVAGALPPPPDKLIDSGGSYKVKYDAPVNRLMRSEDGIGILKTLEALSPMAQIDPSVMDIIDTEETARILADVNGMPSRGLRSKERMAAMKEGREEQAEMATMLQAAPIAAQSAKHLAQAQQLARQSPGALPGMEA